MLVTLLITAASVAVALPVESSTQHKLMATQRNGRHHQPVLDIYYEPELGQDILDEEDDHHILLIHHVPSSDERSSADEQIKIPDQHVHEIYPFALQYIDDAVSGDDEHSMTDDQLKTPDQHVHEIYPFALQYIDDAVSGDDEQHPQRPASVYHRVTEEDIIRSGKTKRAVRKLRK